MLSIKALTCLLISTLSLIAHSADTKDRSFNKVQVYTYHEKPPYFIHDNQASNILKAGIYQDFVDYLNSQQNNNLYELQFMPRLRLEGLLKNRQLDGVIIGANPLWFKDKVQTEYLWTEAIMEDKDIFLVNSNSTINFNFKQTEDFEGLRFALTRGSYYKGITELIKQGKIPLSKTNSAKQNMEMLAHNRTDVTIMSELTANYFFNTLYPRHKFKILAIPHDKFKRMILIPKNKKNLHQELSIIVNKAASDKAWQGRLEKWRAKEPLTNH